MEEKIAQLSKPIFQKMDKKMSDENQIIMWDGDNDPQ